MSKLVWDTETHEGYVNYTPPAHPTDAKLPESGTVWRVPVGTPTKYGVCVFCKTQVQAGKYIWVSMRQYLCDSCASRFRSNTSRGYTHRCIECSLVRCAGEGHRCEECAENIARTEPSASPISKWIVYYEF